MDINEAELECIFGMSRLFTQRDYIGRIILLMAKVTDNFLLGRSVEAMECLLVELCNRFIVGKVVMDSLFHFNAWEIEEDHEGHIKMLMIRYVEQIKAVALSRTRLKKINYRPPESAFKQF